MGLQPVVIFTEVRCVVIKKKFPMKYSPRALAGSIGPAGVWVTQMNAGDMGLCDVKNSSRMRGEG